MSNHFSTPSHTSHTSNTSTTISLAQQKARAEVKVLAQNKKASFEYTLEKTFEAGIVLESSDVKAIMEKRTQLLGAWVSVIEGEAFLVNYATDATQNNGAKNEKVAKPKKLLLHKSEIIALSVWSEQKGYSLIPTQIYCKNNRIKVSFSLAKGKKQYDKRQAIKQSDTERQTAIVLKHKTLKRG